MHAPEKTLQRWFCNNAPGHWHIQSLESSTGLGIPDLVVTLPGRIFWLELKVNKGRLHLRPAQWAWAQRNILAGGTVFALHRPPGPEWRLHDLKHATVGGAGELLLVETPPTRTGTDFPTLCTYLLP